MTKILATTALAACLLLSAPAHAREITVDLIGVGNATVGKATLKTGTRGVLVTIEVKGLPSGWHGVHFHGKGDCADHADHFQDAGAHASRKGEKHGFFAVNGPEVGDLPNLWVHADGSGRAEYFTTFATEDDLWDDNGTSIMIHEAADDYVTQPAGQAGARIACGVIKAGT